MKLSIWIIFQKFCSKISTYFKVLDKLTIGPVHLDLFRLSVIRGPCLIRYHQMLLDRHLILKFNFAHFSTDTPLAPFFEDCINEQDLDEMNIEIIRNTLYKSYLESFFNFCKNIGGETEVSISVLFVNPAKLSY